MNEGRRKAWLSCGVCFVTFVSGCLEDNDAGGISFPAPPAVVDAAYNVTVWDRFVGIVFVSGHTYENAFLGDGTIVKLPTLRFVFNITRDDGVTTLNSYTIHQHMAGGGRLASVSIQCEGPRNPCAAGANDTLKLVPDARDAFGFLGLGALLGQRVSFGAEFSLSVWDPSGTTRAAWSVGSRIEDNGTTCAWFEVESPTGPKSPAAFVFSSGRFLACAGESLPRIVALSGIGFTRIKYEASGILPVPSPPPLSNPQGTPCRIPEPMRNATVLNASSYVSWARANDSNLRNWFGAHPSGVVFPAYGQVRVDPNLYRSYRVPVQFVTYDPVSGETSMWLGAEAHTYAGTGMAARELASSMEASRKVGGNYQASAGDLACEERDVSLREIVQKVGGPSQVAAHNLRVFVAPEVGALWQNSHALAGPFAQPSGFPHLEAPEAHRFPSWPPRAYITGPGKFGDGAAPLIGTAVDPASFWIRWADAEPAAWKFSP